MIFGVVIIFEVIFLFGSSSILYHSLFYHDCREHVVVIVKRFLCVFLCVCLVILNRRYL